MTEKAKPFKATTPRGVFKFPNLVTPDYGTKDFPKVNGEWNVRLILDASEAQGLIAKLNPEFAKAKLKAEEEFAKLPIATRKKLKDVTFNDFYTEVYDKETEEPTGQIEFRFKSAASGVSKDKKKWERKVALFDAKGVPIKKIAAIWGGTVGKVSFTASPYFIPGTGAAGLSLRLEAVQIIELSAGGSRNASEYGFGAEEDGYDSTEESAGFTDETSGDADATGGDEADTDNEDF